MPVPSSRIKKSKYKAFFLDFLTLEDGIDRLSFNVSKELALHAVSQPRKVQISKQY
jgi:hypothetical protein